MSFTIYDASVPVFVHSMASIQAWLDKTLAEGKSETAVLESRLAPDMRPFPAQIQMASDSAKNAVARLAGISAPAMPDVEASFAELKDRCRRTIAFIEGIHRSALEGAEEREVKLKFPNGTGYRFNGRDYLTGFALPNFFFHVTMTYALLRAQGVAVGKPDFLQHLGAPNIVAGAQSRQGTAP
jgi:hypothetical protein